MRRKNVTIQYTHSRTSTQDIEITPPTPPNNPELLELASSYSNLGKQYSTTNIQASLAMFEQELSHLIKYQKEQGINCSELIIAARFNIAVSNLQYTTVFTDAADLKIDEFFCKAIQHFSEVVDMMSHDISLSNYHDMINSLCHPAINEVPTAYLTDLSRLIRKLSHRALVNKNHDNLGFILEKEIEIMSLYNPAENIRINELLRYLCNVTIKAKDFDHALSYLETAIKIPDHTPESKIGIAGRCCSLAHEYRKAGNNTNALKCLKQALDLISSTDPNIGIAGDIMNVCQKLAIEYQLHNDRRSAASCKNYAYLALYVLNGGLPSVELAWMSWELGKEYIAGKLYNDGIAVLKKSYTVLQQLNIEPVADLQKFLLEQAEAMKATESHNVGSSNDSSSVAASAAAAQPHSTNMIFDRIASEIDQHATKIIFQRIESEIRTQLKEKTRNLNANQEITTKELVVIFSSKKFQEEHLMRYIKQHECKGITSLHSRENIIEMRMPPESYLKYCAPVTSECSR